MSDWKPILDAIVGARHGGRIDGLPARLRDLDRRHPHQPEIVAELAFTLVATGDFTDALAAYERAFALGLPSTSEQANALIGHATCLLRLNRAEEAMIALERAHLQFPDHTEFAAFLAIARYRAGQTNEAFAGLLALLAETSDDIGIAAHQRTLRSLVN